MDVQSVLESMEGKAQPKSATVYGLGDNRDWSLIKEFAKECGVSQSRMISILWGEFSDKFQDFTREDLVKTFKK